MFEFRVLNGILIPERNLKMKHWNNDFFIQLGKPGAAVAATITHDDAIYSLCRLQDLNVEINGILSH